VNQRVRRVDITRRRTVAAGGLAFAFALAAAGGAGCDSQDKILRYKPFFTNIEGAVTATPAIGAEPDAPVTNRSSTDPESAASSSDEPVDPSALAESYYDRLGKLPDSKIRLEAGDIGTLIRHLRWTLDTDRDEVLVDWLLAEDLLTELRQRKQEPQDYVDWLHDHRRDIEAMLARMPMAERSPTVIYEQTGKRQYCVRLTGSAQRGMKFTELWVAMERGKYRLLWIS
jgi:hypothetical protein